MSLPIDVQAQVQIVHVSKGIGYVQTSATGVALGPVPVPCRGCPFMFSADVSGTNIGSITAPTISGPINVAALGTFWNNGRLVYSSAEGQWRFGANGDDWSGATSAILNSLYGNGTYTFTVNGATIPLSLTGDAYPNTPTMRFSQGAWKNGKFEFDPGQPLTITTNAFTAYGSHANDVISLGVDGSVETVQLRTAIPGWNPPANLASILVVSGSNTVSLTIPANTFVKGQESGVYASFSAIVDSNLNPALPGSLNIASYEIQTTLTLKAAASVFPMTVTANIGPTVSNATATIQYRPQDVGTTGSVYVFAVAPASIVRGGLASEAMRVGWARGESKADPPMVCVLAQLNSSGQLQAATPAQLQAALTGTLSSLGASVPIMNNVPTPNVAGATFYVGYGSSSTGMITGGIYQSALTVPGASICPMFSSQTALWWNPAESGWGLNLNHQGNIVFGTLFTYDASGAPLWLVMSNGAMQSDGVTFTGDLYRTTGPAFNANPFTPIGAANLTKVGTMTTSFSDVNSGSLRYTVNGTDVTKSIQRQVYGSRAASCLPSTASRATATNYQDLWWNPAESGWGINVTHQDNTLFATLFTYDASGRDLWLVMSAGNRQSDGSFLGDLYRTTGPPFNANPFTPIGPGNVTNVGTMRLRFTDGNNGTLTYTYNGAPVTKSITRQVFSSPAPLCN
jgi:hypothetical protein